LAACGLQAPIDSPGPTSQDRALAEHAGGSNYRVLYSFRGRPDGAGPTGRLIDVNDTLYGATAQGGANKCGSSGCGTVFSITTSGSEKVLYSFSRAPDGYDPRAS